MANAAAKSSLILMSAYSSSLRPGLSVAGFAADYGADEPGGKAVVAFAGKLDKTGQGKTSGDTMTGRQALKTLASAGAALAALVSAPVAAAECGELAQMALPDGTVTAATLVAPGAFQQPGLPGNLPP